MKEFIDLGLPSGKLWATENEEGYYTFDEAIAEYENQLPSADDWEELFRECDKEIDDERNGIELKANNGNTLFIPFAGRCINRTYDLQGDGYYWTDKKSSTGTPKCVRFHNVDSIDFRVLTEGSISVRIIKTK